MSFKDIAGLCIIGVKRSRSLAAKAAWVATLAEPARDQPTVQSGPRTAARAGGTAKPARDQPTDQSEPRTAARAGGAAEPARDQPTDQLRY